MDLGIVAALAMLAVWAVGTFAYGAPGWIHLLLTVGVYLLIHRIVARGTSGETDVATRRADSPTPPPDAR